LLVLVFITAFFEYLSWPNKKAFAGSVVADTDVTTESVTDELSRIHFDNTGAQVNSISNSYTTEAEPLNALLPIASSKQNHLQNKLSLNQIRRLQKNKARTLRTRLAV